MDRTYWLSYDLGVGGDYEHLYQWLDDHDALSCGDSVAYFRYTTRKRDIDKALSDDLINQVNLKPGNILYIIRKVDTGEIRGRFLYGKRKAAPWVGYGSQPSGSMDE